MSFTAAAQVVSIGCWNNCPRVWSETGASGTIGYGACEQKARQQNVKFFSVEDGSHCWIHSETSIISTPRSQQTCAEGGQSCVTHVYELRAPQCGSYRYYKWIAPVSRKTPENFMSIGEIDFGRNGAKLEKTAPIVCSPNTDNCQALDSHEWATAQNNDGSSANWKTPYGYAIYDFGTPVTIDQYRVRERKGDWAFYNPTGWLLYGRNGASEPWKLLDDVMYKPRAEDTIWDSKTNNFGQVQLCSPTINAKSNDICNGVALEANAKICTTLEWALLHAAGAGYVRYCDGSQLLQLADKPSSQAGGVCGVAFDGDVPAAKECICKKCCNRHEFIFPINPNWQDWPRNNCKDSCPAPPADPCASVTCQNDGSCAANGATYVCNCKPEWQGKHCETPLPKCNENNLVAITGAACKCAKTSTTAECAIGKYCVKGYSCNNSPTCAASHTVAITGVACDCGSSSCAVGKFCYDGGCHTNKGTPPCTPDAYYAIDTKCNCASTECAVGKFCHSGSCTSAAACTVRSDIDSEFFYGAKLEGTWNQVKREMSLVLPVPGDVKVSKITWMEAQTQNLAYDAKAATSSWTKDTTNQCRTQFKLTVGQDDFFGKGSRFTLTGKQMKTALKVDATERVMQTIDGYSYSRKREMNNIVPLVVNLVEKTTVRAHFNTVFSNEKTVELHVQHSTVAAQQATFLTQCNGLLAQFSVTCQSIAAKTTLPIGNLIITLAGTNAQIQQAISYLKINGYKTANFGRYNVEKKAAKHNEFVFTIAAKETTANTIEIEMEVHSRSCIDHSLADKGVRVTAAGKLKIDESIAKTTFVWKKDPSDNTKYLQTREHNLCVEKVTWTFAPKGYEQTSYDIPIEFSLKKNLGTFVTFAKVNVKQADVLGDIGFGANAALYKDAAATQTATSFQLGDKFYIKITLEKAAVDAASINCEKLTLTQTNDAGAKKATNMKEAQYNFMENQSALNTVICGSELAGTGFYARVDGYHTDLEIIVKVNYKQGKQADIIRLRRRLIAAPNPVMDESALGFENQVRHADDSEVIDLDMEILPAVIESAIGLMQKLSGRKNFKGPLIALTLLSSGVYLVHNFMSRKQNGEYTQLLEV